MVAMEEIVARLRAASPEIGPRLAALCDQARREHPALALDDQQLIAAIAGHAPDDPAEVAGYLDRCRPGDLALAAAAAQGSPVAIGELERRYQTALDAVVRRFTDASHPADDLRQILRARLFVADGARPPKIADYAGQGFLENWLRITAVRIFLDVRKRKDRAREAPADEDAVLALPEPGDLALEVIKSEYRAAVAVAIRDAAQRLPPGDRHLLRQHLVAGLSIDQLGAALGIHRATAARRIAKARDQLAIETRRLVAERLALAPDEMEEVLGLVISRLDVSLARLFASEAGR
jgi:RNA polymerase sigma-70 factor (ECF subfamily)